MHHLPENLIIKAVRFALSFTLNFNRVSEQYIEFISSDVLKLPEDKFVAVVANAFGDPAVVNRDLIEDQLARTRARLAEPEGYDFTDLQNAEFQLSVILEIMDEASQ